MGVASGNDVVRTTWEQDRRYSEHKLGDPETGAGGAGAPSGKEGRGYFTMKGEGVGEESALIVRI